MSSDGLKTEKSNNPWLGEFFHDEDSFVGQLDALFRYAPVAVTCSRIIYSNRKPTDRLVLYANPAFKPQTGHASPAGKLASDVYGGGQAKSGDLEKRLAHIARSGKPEIFEHRCGMSGRWYSISAYSPLPDYVIAIFANISDRKQNEERREAHSAELERMLEQGKQP